MLKADGPASGLDQSFPGRLIAGAGARARAGEICAGIGQRVIVVAGGSSLERGGFLAALLEDLGSRGLSVRTVRVSGEPTSMDADRAAAAAREFGADCLLGAGGGSVLDLAKAAAALAPLSGGAEDYLEGLGGKAHPGACLPWIALPTTAGTGSECTTNAVLKGRGPGGKPYKRSLRHPNLLPRAAILDPDLQRDCPASVSAPCAFDALSQLMESASSRRADPVTDAFAFQGLRLIAPAMERLLKGQAGPEDRLALSLAASFSGIALSGAGLGLVHGIAGCLGASSDAPHGSACAALVFPCFKESLAWLARTKEETDPVSEAGVQARLGLDRFALISRALGCGELPGDFVDLLERWTRAAALQPLAPYLRGGDGIDETANASTYRDSYARLGKDDVRGILALLSAPSDPITTEPTRG